MSNSEAYPEAWEFFIELARNIEQCPDLKHLGSYRIPKPDRSGEFLYSDHPGKLFVMFKDEFYRMGHDAPSVYGKIQYIVRNFSH